MGTFRGPRAEDEEGPLSVSEGAATEVGCEKGTVIVGPEARSELPTFLYARVAEEQLRQGPAELSTRPACPMAY